MAVDGCWVPVKVEGRIFEFVNQLRIEFHLPALQLHEGFSLLAGEHSCNMSIHDLPFGHTGFSTRVNHLQLALAYSENIASFTPSAGGDDPASGIIRSWIERSSSFSRFFGSFTHTGIGVAESVDGVWYATQIFATLPLKFSKKVFLLLFYRSINHSRTKGNFPQLQISLSVSAKLSQYIRANNVTPPESMVQTWFSKSSRIKLLARSIGCDTNSVSRFLRSLSTKEDVVRLIQTPAFTHVALMTYRDSAGNLWFIAYLATMGTPYRAVPRLHLHFQEAARFLQVLNDYRAAHGKREVAMSHQFCRVCAKQAQRIKAMVGGKVGDTSDFYQEMRGFTKNVRKCFGELVMTCEMLVIPFAEDPIPEILVVWSSQVATKEKLLRDSRFMGFAVVASDDGGEAAAVCFACAIIGDKGGEHDGKVAAEIHHPMTEATALYLKWESDDDDGVIELPAGAAQ